MTYRCQEIGHSQLGSDFNSRTSVTLSLCLYERKILSLSAVVAFLFTASSTLKRGKKRYYGKIRCQGYRGVSFSVNASLVTAVHLEAAPFHSGLSLQLV